ncbi:MAG: phosphoribosylamine--glycine ligase [Epulopiscium sp. Nuni2H_MBin003]|nr:MAG: phosphoribosylamine--glycine ligase [Epulopiscium sp. Nuni2H_MBin003]
MKVLIIGNGGRESAIYQALSKAGDEIWITPHSFGINSVDIPVTDTERLLQFADNNKIDFVVVGPEVPLVNGIVDDFTAKGYKIFGPNKKCAQFEGSKKFTKEFLMRNNIPTAKYLSFDKTQQAEAISALEKFSLPVVVKADGLAAGKGVLICETYDSAEQAIIDIFNDTFKGAGETLVIEEFLDGIEASLLCFVDENTIVPLETARDYKRIFNDDKGENTGGMGGYSPNPIVTEDIKKLVLEPILNGFKKENFDYRGVLFIGLMIKDNTPYVLEFNVRFGDPETQSVLPRLKTNLLDVLLATADGNLSNINLEWDERCSVTVVLASAGYPKTYVENNVQISGLDLVDKDVIICHAGTRGETIPIVNGGRVLSLTALADTLDQARKKVYNQIKNVSFDGMQYRTDIAKS